MAEQNPAPTGIGQELLNVPMGEMIRDMALSIAEAQIALDTSSMRVAEMMSGWVWERDEKGKLKPAVPGQNPQDTRVDFTVFKNGARTTDKLSMMELGFTPTFYQFVD